ncbi:glucuronate isomerase [Rhodophyticola sp. CCM32]|uniref:glucuronate isomerase n=1 Tax=Rhodophyticola sp. CCM32 TaxID=2916397 RepID=UPI00107F7701|nr:glucuronate isomerase [Rhodophyticola sp. CCM32]QBY01739.1 glucuronate isomerase [Rhodophyticola sp. CCM32]
MGTLSADDLIIGQDGLARALYDTLKALPILSPHGHCDPEWFAGDAPFSDPANLLIVPDHYVLRMLVSQGVRLEDMGVARQDGTEVETDPRVIWDRFAAQYYLFAGTPTRVWLDYTFETLFGLHDPLCPATATAYYDRISDCLSQEAFRPRALFERFQIEVLATTEGALDPLTHHRAIAESGWQGRVITTYRPDQVTDPDHEGFAAGLDRLADLTGGETDTWAGYLEAHRARRAVFRDHGATATDHGHPTAETADLARDQAVALYDRIRKARAEPGDAALFRAQMLTEMARMSADDGMVMQIHAGSYRNHNRAVFEMFGRDKGFDIPTRTDYVHALRPLLNAVGMAPGFRLILFTLDETAYSRELAPLAGAYPCLRLGPAWWFHDSPEGMRRFREMTTETAGFYNTVGFNDDTRAFPSIPARHDMARRVDCAFLARLVGDGRLREAEAFDLARVLTIDLPKQAYRL